MRTNYNAHFTLGHVKIKGVDLITWKGDFSSGGALVNKN